ncbi:MAG: DDE-type integrase/transposase/recombinase [Gammaproteobacteria bacterium]|nr:DDE-type integrase/transposase/recombinase [Gammaproteobacteria bacterium]
MDKRRTTKVAKRTLQYALKKRRPPSGLIFHSDRGGEYRGDVFQKALNLRSVRHSLNWAGHCTDNAHMESFFQSMKAELIRGTRYVSGSQLRYDLVKYIYQLYNKKRLHAEIEYHSPIEYEQLAA